MAVNADLWSMQQLQRGRLLTSEQEKNDPFPKPLRPQPEGGGSSGDFVTETPGQPHKLPSPLEGEEQRGKKDRYKIPDPKMSLGYLKEAFNVFNKRSLYKRPLGLLRILL